MSITYRIELETTGEGREAPVTFTDFKKAVKACHDHAVRHIGVKVRVVVTVPMNKLVDHTYVLFESYRPRLDDFMVKDIKRHFGEEP
jgi:hypothetical protein